MVKGITDCKGEKITEGKKKCCVDNRSRDGRIYFSWKKLITFCWVTWNRDHLICAKDLCKRCAHTQVSERIRSSVIRTFKRCIYWQKLHSSLWKGVWPVGSDSFFSVFTMTKSVWVVLSSNYRHHYSNGIYLPSL